MRSFLALLVFDARYQKLKFRCAFLLYLAVIVIGSLPGTRAEVGEYASGLVLHGFTYSVITFLLFGGTSGGAWGKAFKALLIITVMGVLDEYVQSFFPYRTASIMDWFVDISAGFLTSALLLMMWSKQASDTSKRGSQNSTLPLARELPDQMD
jgi:VanZ family protein